MTSDMEEEKKKKKRKEERKEGRKGVNSLVTLHPSSLLFLLPFSTLSLSFPSSLPCHFPYHLRHKLQPSCIFTTPHLVITLFSL